MDCQAAVQVVVLADLIDVQDFLVVYNIPWNLFRSNGLFVKLATFFLVVLCRPKLLFRFFWKVVDVFLIL